MPCGVHSFQLPILVEIVHSLDGDCSRLKLKLGLGERLADDGVEKTSRKMVGDAKGSRSVEVAALVAGRFEYP